MKTLEFSMQFSCKLSTPAACAPLRHTHTPRSAGLKTNRGWVCWSVADERSEAGRDYTMNYCTKISNCSPGPRGPPRLDPTPPPPTPRPTSYDRHRRCRRRLILTGHLPAHYIY